MKPLRLVASLVLCAALAGCPSAQTAKKPTTTPKPANPEAAAYAAQCTQMLADARKLRESIVSADANTSAMDTLKSFNQLRLKLTNSGWHADLIANVHPSKPMREAAEKCVQDSDKLSTELALDRGLYDALVKVDTSKLDPDGKRFVEQELRDFRRAGVDKNEETRKKIQALNEEIVEIGQEFERITREDERFVEVDSADALAGLPQDYIDSHKPGENGKIKITTAYPDLWPVLNYGENAELRKELYVKFRDRGYPKNIDVLDKLLVKRYELAQLLGYDNWADYITEDKMIGDAKTVQEFIDKITKIAGPRAEREVEMLLDEKRKHDKDAKIVEDWEKYYLENLVKKDKFAFDAQSVRPYFQYAAVKKGLMDLTHELYGIDYKKVEGVKVWHPLVEVYDVYDGDQKLGRIFLDMHPRSDKFGHAAHWTTRVGSKGVQLPEGVLVCNFPNPADGPALMEHSQVETFFHEFGHLLHNVLGGQQRWARMSGVATERDFVEAPSQFFEEWTRDVDVLQRFAKHYETGKPIPAELVTKMREANEFGQGYSTRHQMFYAAVSLNYYNQDPANIDTTKLLIDLQKKYAMFPYLENTHFQTSFGHLNGYSAIYYTYMWSLVISKDLLSPFKKNGMLNHETATRYRHTVLEPGGTKDAADLVEDFLGRPYSFKAFQDWLENENM